MIVSTLIKQEEVDEDEYPYIGKHEESNLIVLFTDVGEGVVLYSEEKNNYIGRSANDFNEEWFKVYDLPVTLCNRPYYTIFNGVLVVSPESSSVHN